MSFHFPTKDADGYSYVPGLYDLLHALSCQLYYKWEKPNKFAGGKWSPKAAQIYRSFDSEWKKAFDDAWIAYEEADKYIKSNQSYEYPEVEDSIRKNIGLPTWLEENIIYNKRKRKYTWDEYYTLEELEKQNRERYAITTDEDDEEFDEEEDDKVKLALDESNENIKCPRCGYGMLEKVGKYGKFYGCSQWPSCWKNLPHPDNPGEKKKKERFKIEDGIVEDTYSYFTKRNGKRVKEGTPTEHSITIDGIDFCIKTKGGRKHIHKGDICTFEYTIDWRGMNMLDRRTLKTLKKNGTPVVRRSM